MPRRGGPPPDKVLFVGHGAERTGPPIGLLHLLRWIKANTDIDFEVLLLDGGDLLDEYRALAPTTVLDYSDKPPRLAQLGMFLESTFHREGATDRFRTLAYRRRLRRHGPYRTVYCNSAWTIRVLEYVRMGEQTKVVAAVHELSVGVDYHLSDHHRQLLIDRPDHFLVVSDAVRRNMIDTYGVDPGRISLHHEMIAIEADPPVRDEDAARPSRVAASGLFRWRKGPDLFFAIVADIRRRRPDLDVSWAWIGGDPGAPDRQALRFDVEAAGLADVLELTGHLDRPLDYYQDLDVLVLTSREDAYPLVCLEAASVGVPIVTFVNGGMPEFVDGRVDALEGPRDEPPTEPGRPAGFVVPFPDLRQMADRIIELLDDPSESRRRGACGAERVRRLHAVEVAAPRLVEDLAEWLLPTEPTPEEPA